MGRVKLTPITPDPPNENEILGGWGKGNKRDENDTVNRFLVAERGVGRYLHAY